MLQKKLWLLELNKYKEINKEYVNKEELKLLKFGKLII